MKRVFLFFSLLIGWLTLVQAGTAYYACDNSSEIRTGIEDSGGCEGCILNAGQLRYFNTGGCEYSFLLWPRPQLFPDAECGALSISYIWNFDDGSLPIGPTTSYSQLHSFTANGVYNVCVTVIISNGSTIQCQYDLCAEITVDCISCDVLDCDSVKITHIGETGISFSFSPLEECEECPEPYYNIGWREVGSSSGWNYGGTSVSGGSGSGSISGLDSCTWYEFIIELKCSDSYLGETIDSCITSFMTTGCITGCEIGFDCNEVDTLYVFSNRMGFTYQPILNCPNCPNPYYNVGWRVSTSTTWNYGSTSIGDTSGTIFNLMPCTTYDFIIELKCPDSSSTIGPWLTPTVAECIFSSFTTDCGTPFSAPDLPTRVESFALMNAYPNPAGNEVNIVVFSNLSATGVISIYNNLGALVKQQRAQTNILEVVNLQDLQAGMYYYTFTSPDHTNIRESGKLIIVK